MPRRRKDPIRPDDTQDLGSLQTPPKKKKRKVHWLRILLIVFLCFLLTGVIGGVVVANYVFGLAAELPDITSDDLIMAQTSFVYDSEGTELGALHGGENRITVPLDEMPEHLIDCLLAAEDVRFYEHNGVDWRSVARAASVVIKDSIAAKQIVFSQGASTITMQLVRNVVADTQKTMDRKVKEALLALQFEKNYDKDEILYLYLNEIYLGPRIYGVAAASEYYFNKRVQDINLQEAAVLVGILRNANYYSPYQHPERAKNVRNTVLNQLIVYYPDEYGVTAEAAMQTDMVLSEAAAANTGVDYDHPWFVDYVLTEASSVLTGMDMSADLVFTGGLQIYTTMRPYVQNAMEAAFENPDNFPESRWADIVESGMAVIDPMTGEICGLVGGRVYEARRGFNRATSLARQPGSSIKPVVAYGPAVNEGQGPGTIIDDAPFTGNYNPKNSDHTYAGRITMRRALMSSRNVCAVRTLQSIGTEVGFLYAKRMGLPLDDSDAYNSAMALGGIARGVSPLQMAGAFATFANQGLYTEPYCISMIVDARGNIIYEAAPHTDQVLTPQTAWLMTDMLTSAVSGGTGTNAKISGHTTAGKTGTVELPSAKEDPDYAGKSGTKDVWFVGYTPELCAAVWMGYDNKKDSEGNVQYMGRLYGGGKPASLFKTVLTEALSNQPESYARSEFIKPDKLATVTIDLKSGLKPSSLTPSDYIGSEWFAAAHVPTEESDIWQRVEICEDTGRRATEYCPNRTTAVRITLAEGQTVSSGVADAWLYAPSSSCSEHTTYQANTQAVQICTDSRHGGEKVRANVSADGQSGCPSDSVVTRYYTPENMPAKYCDLEDHAIQYGNQNINNPNDIGGNQQQNPPNTATDPGSSSTPPGNSGSSNQQYDSQGIPLMDTPRNVSVSASGNGCQLTWSADNDAATTIYMIEKITDGDAETRVMMRTQGTYSFTDEDIQPGHSYRYRIYAYNTDYSITSDWSAAVNYSR